MKEIILTDGQKAKVDNVDFDRLNKHIWYPVYDEGEQLLGAAAMIDGREVFMHDLVYSWMLAARN